MDKILIVSNYYPPEKGAAANRIGQLAVKLRELRYDVSVVCPLPNYPKGKIFPGYNKKLSATEIVDRIIVKRLWIYPSNSKNIIKRVISILSFSTGLFFHLLFGDIPKKVVVQSPPLLLSFVSVAVLSMRKRKVILNVSDLWPLAAIELKALNEGSFGHKAAKFMERFIYKNSTVILGQSEEILMHIHKMYPDKEMHLYRNFPDHKPSEEKKRNENPIIKIFYAGLLGVAQGVAEVCQKINIPDNIELHIFGDGAEMREIQEYILRNPAKNIRFHGMLDRNDLISALKSFDIAIVPLKTRIFGSVPSKIFEYSALGMPVLYFGGGEGNDIVRENNLGWVAEVANFDELNAAMQQISVMEREKLERMKTAVREHSALHFNLDRQMKELIEKGVF